jgi:hypothetical protein
MDKWNLVMDIRAILNRRMIKTVLFHRKDEIYVFFTVAFGEARKINAELFELSDLPKKSG